MSLQSSSAPYTKAKIAGILAETGRIFASLQATLKGISHPVIVISSAAAKEGKSTFTAGLGIVAARNLKEKVLLIDCHWHAPSLHTFFEISTNFNLEKSLLDDNLREQVIATPYANLDLLPAPSYLEKPEATKNALATIKKLRNDYALTIVDSAAILSANRNMVDPIALAAEADGLALAVLANRTPRQMIKKAQTMLEVSGSRVLGLIINQYCNPLAT
ncbi:MAG: CpsD/CapB family tyrosine-protein kinase [Deltaproteobacteria bacterium]|nr:CpsD/CapB family tyrosine-protein kinase [Deltaproteobacteria bacterium]